MTQDQIILLLDLKASMDRGAASMSCDQRIRTAEGMVALRMIEKYGYGYRITENGIKYLARRKDKVKR